VAGQPHAAATDDGSVHAELAEPDRRPGGPTPHGAEPGPVGPHSAASVQPAADGPEAASPGAPQPAGEGQGGPVNNRRAGGTLRAAILAILAAHPGRQFKVAELCKAIDAANTGSAAAKASQGAVHNAVVKLVADGAAVQTVERPATFTLATAPVAAG
jgi:hypothetical protein